MQIAFFTVAKIEKKDRGTAVFAKKTRDLLFIDKGHNLLGFMTGRKICVISCFFIIARVTTIEIEESQKNVLGVPDGLQNFLNTGLCGAIIRTILGSISWQLVVSAFPLTI